jgi:naphthalene 1,2-dioxygenase ferredoxin reductase component
VNSVGIRQVGRTLHVQEGQDILRAALEAGIAYPHGCKSGRCGSCKSRLITGEVDLLECGKFALTQKERGERLILACRALPRTDVVVAWLGDDDDVPAHPHRTSTAEVVAIDDATHDIRRVRLAIEGEPMEFAPGQYARLTFPGAPARDYSMASQPGEETLEFHVRRVAGGVASEIVANSLRVGDRVGIEGPFGSSYLRMRHEGPIVAIAGGSGLAPIKSIVNAALRGRMEQPIHLYFGARARRDLYMVDHFTRLAREHSNLSFVPTLSEVDAPGTLRTGFVSDAVAEDIEDCTGWKAYLAGPPAMVDAALAVLYGKGIRPEDIHADVFFTPPPGASA